MRKFIPLAIIALYFNIVGAFAQTADSASYRSRKLKVEEVNLVSGYYQQEGNNSAVTGGVGDEHLTDIANAIDLKMYKFGKSPYIKHHFNFELGVDTYTSASSDKIDPSTISSPSASDLRIYPSLTWGIENEKKKTRFDLTASYSNEFDYQSIGGSLGFSKTSQDANQEFSLKLQAFFDTWDVILPIELRNSPQDFNNSSPRNSFSAALSFSQVINKNLQVLFSAEPGYQDGLLATKYQRVYFINGSHTSENLPGKRYKLPLSVRANYFLNDKIIVRSFYRFYTDDWGINANTAELELPVKFSPFFSLSPFYRYYNQTQSEYFAPYGKHLLSDAYFTSDYDLSKFNSNLFGIGIRLSPPKGLLNFQHFKTAEIRYGHYSRSNGLNSNVISLALGFK